MKKMLKKTIAVILTVAMLSTCGFAFMASALVATSIPTIYVHGQGDTLYANAYDRSTEAIWDEIIPEGALDGLVDIAAGPLVKGVMSGDYTEYANVLCDFFEPIYSKVALGPTGEPTDGSGRHYSTNNINYYRTPEQGYYYNSFTFSYDWRCDPVKTAGLLNDFIDKVLSGTKAEKVNIVGRCLGANIVLAYISEYCKDDLSKINKVAFYCAGFDGFDVCNAIFSGQADINADALERFLRSNYTDESELAEFIKATVNVLNSIKGLQFTIDEIMDIYEAIRPIVMPRMLNASFGTFPAYWSMVGDKYYDSAKELYFSDKDPEEYAHFISLIDYYHDNIGTNAAGLINKLLENDIEVGIFSKYDSQMIPISEHAVNQSDDYVCVKSSSFGAECAQVTKTFSADYLAEAEAKGTLKYINPEKTIDASTALLPDHTWFIKGVDHMSMPEICDDLIFYFFAYDGYLSVFDEENYPQYVLYTPTSAENGTLTPVTEENSTSHDEWNPNIFESFKTVFEFLINYIIKIVDTIKNAILSNSAASKAA